MTNGNIIGGHVTTIQSYVLQIKQTDGTFYEVNLLQGNLYRVTYLYNGEEVIDTGRLKAAYLETNDGEAYFKLTMDFSTQYHCDIRTINVINNITPIVES